MTLDHAAIAKRLYAITMSTNINSAIIDLLKENAELKIKYQAVYHAHRLNLKTYTRIREVLINIRDDIDDQGDRAFFGSTNDADAFKELVDDLDLIVWDETINPPHKETRALSLANEELQAEVLPLRVEVQKLREALEPFCRKSLHDCFDADTFEDRDRLALNYVEKDDGLTVSVGELRAAAKAMGEGE